MSRRKNFGEGYGYTFHGSFTEKKDAEAKEAKTPGSFVRGTPTAKGYRWMVMKPRKNPIRRASGSRKQPRVKTYKLRSSLTRKTRKATMVVLPDGREYKFDEIVPKRIAIREALRHLGIGDNPCMVGINPQRYEVIEVSADKKRRVLVSGVTKEEGRESLKRMKLLWGKYGVKFELKAQSGASRNPIGAAELIVMGANPGDDPHYLEAVRQLFPGKSPRDLNAKETSEALQLAARIKHGRTGTNPTNPGGSYSSAHARAAGITRQAPGLIQTKQQRRVARMVRSARKHKLDWAEDFGREIRERNLNPRRRNVEFGEFENGIFHPWTRRSRSRRKHAIRRRARLNPSAEGIREYFTGAPVGAVHVENEPHMPAGDYAQLGELLVLYVKPIAGGQVKQIAFRGESRPAVVADETARQIWFVAGDQDISASVSEFGAQELGEASGVFLLGEARRIDYKQRKEHVPDPDVDEWRHDFGEETGVRPALLFDSNLKRFLLSGGEYEIRPEGIVN
jgi:hypothetical protein